MKIGIVGSMQFTEQLVDLQTKLNNLGHEAFLTDLHEIFVGKTNAEKELIKIDQKNNKDAIRAFWNQMQGADAILVANYDKHGIKNISVGILLWKLDLLMCSIKKYFFLTQSQKYNFI